MNKVLLISDDTEEANTLIDILQQRDILTQIVPDWERAIIMWETDSADLIIVLRLPSYVQPLPKTLKEHIIVPIIFVADKYDEQYHIRLLEQGVSQIVQRPFSLLVLVLQIQAYLRHTTYRATMVPAEWVVGDLRLDKSARSISSGTYTARLSRLEFQLFEMLWRQRPRVVSTEQIVSVLWGHSDIGDHLLVRKIVHRLRKKLTPLAELNDCIKNIPWTGYHLDVSF